MVCILQGAPQNQAPAPQRYQVPVKQVEPPPSTITLRPQAPVSQAPPPLVTSQPATATLRGTDKYNNTYYKKIK